MDWTTLIDYDKQLLLSVNGSHSLFLDALVRTLTNAWTWVPLYASLVYLVLKNNDRMWKVLMVIAGAALCVLIAGTLDDMLVKPMVARWRPSRDAEIAMLVDVVDGYRGGRFGFFSAHASNTFSIAVFFSLLIRNRLLTVSLVTWSLVNCWTRMYLGVHFPGDILAGLLWGGLVGTGIWYLFQRIKRRVGEDDNFISTQYTPTGYLLTDVDVVICVLVATLVYAIIKSCFALYFMS